MRCDVQVLALSALVVLASVVLSADTEVVRVFGRVLPELCWSRRLFDMDCLGCGLTRSFVLTAHGRLGTAFEVHLLGPLLWAGVALQLPYRAWRLQRRGAANDAT